MYRENKETIYVISNSNFSPCGRILTPSSNNLFTLYKCSGYRNGWDEFEVSYCEIKKINLSFSEYEKFKLKNNYYNKKIEYYNKFE